MLCVTQQNCGTRTSKRGALGFGGAVQTCRGGGAQRHGVLGPRQRNWPLCAVIVFGHRTYPNVREVN